MKVNILLATYNGERYLAQQIESIRQQTFKEWHLLIRDDGSRDKTVSIIEEFVKKDPRISFINPDQRDNIGVINNFFTLLKHDKADVYFFSDQDDVWLPNKLEVTLTTAQTYDMAEPLMVYTDLSVVNDRLEMMHESMIRTQSHHANTKLHQELTENTVTGGTAMINHALAESWTSANGLLMHDWYLALVASAIGNLVYIDQPTELYRQHESNVLGARTLSKRMKNWLNPQQLVSKYWWLIRSSQKQAKQLLALDLSEDKREMIEHYVSLLDKPLLERARTLKTYGFAKNRAFHTFVFTTLILTKFGYRRELR
ncbi:glycosyltransferase family 2 protein [Streptococcus fryi]